MPDVTRFSVEAVGIANCAVTLALIEKLIDKGVLSDADARGIFTHAAERLGARAATVESAAEALQMVNDVLLPRFDDNGV